MKFRVVHTLGMYYVDLYGPDHRLVHRTERRNSPEKAKTLAHKWLKDGTGICGICGCRDDHHAWCNI